MAFVNSKGLSVSFECTDLIKELEPGEQLVKMPAVELLKLYEKENEVF